MVVAVIDHDYITPGTKPPIPPLHLPMGDRGKRSQHHDERLLVDPFTIERARRGDRDAAAEILRAMQDLWFRFCLSQLGGDGERARDATQETAVRFLRQLPTYRGDARIESWSIGIAINVIREQRRANKHQAPGPAPTNDSPRERSYEPQTPAYDHDEIAKLRSVIDDLPDRQRQAITLRFFEELTVDETASAMNCAAGTVKATIHQALRAIKRKLEAPRAKSNRVSD
jgi:RNA polymerase sigma-70 factor (ECF subfamily)